jgi:phosphatidylserine/phosphatidylglycerophosphate/cardiolipin synthase-like enzyme
MRIFKKSLLFLLLISMSAVTFAGTFNVTVEPEDGVQPVIDLINSAKKTIDVSIYEMLGNPAGGASTVTPVMQALTNASKKGVAVRYILNNFPAGPNAWPAYGPQIITNEQNWGKSSNIPITLASPKFKFTHNKYMVIDYGTATATSMVMTGNLTADSFPNNGTPIGNCKNFYIQDNDKSHIDFLHNLFETDLKNAANSTANTPTYMSPYEITPTSTPASNTFPPKFDLFVSSSQAPYPQNNINNFVNMINSATETLDIYMMYFGVYNPNYDGTTGEPNPEAIITAIQNVAEKGVKVRMLCSNLASQTGSKGYYGDAATLNLLSVSENISIAVPQVLSSPGKAGYYDYDEEKWTTYPVPGVLDTNATNNLMFVHTKVYIADGKRVMLGSMNMSNSSLMDNRELDITSVDSSLVDPVKASFETDWKTFYPKYKYTSADSWNNQTATENKGNF